MRQTRTHSGRDDNLWSCGKFEHQATAEVRFSPPRRKERKGGSEFAHPGRGGGAPNYPNYGINSHIGIGTMWKMYSAAFTAPVTAIDGRIQFWFGQSAGNVWIDKVQLTQVSGVYRRDFTNGIVLLNGTPNGVIDAYSPGPGNLILDVSSYFAP